MAADAHQTNLVTLSGAGAGAARPADGPKLVGDLKPDNVTTESARAADDPQRGDALGS
jgi:hypothetical protein